MTIVDTGSFPRRGWGVAALGVVTLERPVLLDGTLVVLGTPGFLCPLETSFYLVLAPIRYSDSQPKEDQGQ